MVSGIEYQCHWCGFEAVESELKITPGKGYRCPGCGGHTINPKEQPPISEVASFHNLMNEMGE